MRRIVVLGLVLLLAANAAVTPAGEQSKDLSRVVIPVEGMTCGGCVVSIKIALKRMDGIVEVDGDHEKGTATVTYRRDKVSVERIVDRINEKTSFKASLPEKKTEQR